MKCRKYILSMLSMLSGCDVHPYPIYDLNTTDLGVGLGVGTTKKLFKKACKLAIIAYIQSPLCQGPLNIQ